MRVRTLTLLSSLTVAVGCTQHKTPQVATPPGDAAAQVAVPVAPDDRLAETARQDWAQRHDVSKLRQAIAAWEQLAASRPDDARLAVQLAEAYACLADTRRYDSLLEVKHAHEQGLRASESALSASLRHGETTSLEATLKQATPEKFPALFWYATHLAGYAERHGLTTLLHLRPRVVRLFEYLLAQTEGVDSAAIHRSYATFLARTPEGLGGDLALARHHFESALALDASSAPTLVAFAETYALETSDRELFERLLRQALATKAAGDANTIVAQQRAATLLARADQLF